MTKRKYYWLKWVERYHVDGKKCHPWKAGGFELFKGLESYTFDCTRATCICMPGKFWSSESFMPQFGSAAKQQISWVFSLWRSPLTFAWPGFPKQRGLQRHLANRNAIWQHFRLMRFYLVNFYRPCSSLSQAEGKLYYWESRQPQLH